MAGTGLCARDVRLMQGLAQQLTPDLQNSDATVGELAWGWGKDHVDLGGIWRHRLWFSGGDLAGWGWVSLPHQRLRSDGQILDMTMAALRWQVHPDSPHLLDDIDDLDGALASDALRRLAAHGRKSRHPQIRIWQRSRRSMMGASSSARTRACSGCPNHRR